jgi:transaldolase
MKFFLDTANLDEIRQAAEMGLIDGVTTNPSLIAKEKADFRVLLPRICALVPGPVSAEVVSLEYEGMVREGRELAKIAPNITIKVPITLEGLRAVRTFSGEGIKTNVTLVFSPLQALLAAKAGATFVSPFVGRLDDVSTSGMELISQIVEIFDNYAFATEVLVASVRHPMHVVEAALMGAHVATIPFKVLTQFVQHPLTDAGIAKFLEDWKKLPNNTIV